MKNDKVNTDRFRTTKFTWRNPTKDMVRNFRFNVRDKLKIAALFLGATHILIPGIENFDLLFKISIVIIFVCIGFTYLLPYLIWKSIYMEYNKFKKEYI